MNMKVETNLLGKKCYYDRMFMEQWRKTEFLSEIMAVVVDDNIQQLIVKNPNGKLVPVDLVDVYIENEEFTKGDEDAH